MAGWAARMVSRRSDVRAARKLWTKTTLHERMLWRALRGLPPEGMHLRLQALVGTSIGDFFCPAGGSYRARRWTSQSARRDGPPGRRDFSARPADGTADPGALSRRSRLPPV